MDRTQLSTGPLAVAWLSGGHLKSEIVRIVASDLQFLREEWDQTVDDDSLRRSSPVLRRLLVQGELQQAWKAAGFPKQPVVEASDLDPILNTIPKDRIRFASAGGARCQGMELRGLLMTSHVMSDTERHQLEKAPLSRSYKLMEFIDASCLVIDGSLVSRRVLVKYVSNKLGGAHFDARRKRNKNDRLYVKLDYALKSAKLLDKPAVYFELLSAGQALVSSPDLEQFTRSAAVLAP